MAKLWPSHKRTLRIAASFTKAKHGENARPHTCGGVGLTDLEAELQIARATLHLLTSRAPDPKPLRFTTDISEAVA